MAIKLLKKWYLTTIIWYAKLTPKRRKCFIVCECVSSHPANLQLTYESLHKNGNLIWKWASNTMICMPVRGSVNTKSQILTPRVLVQRHPYSHEIPVKFDLSTEGTWNTPGTAHKCSPEIFPQTEELSDITDTYPDLEPDVETSLEQQNNSTTNPRNSKYNLRLNPKLNCSDDYRYYFLSWNGVFHGTRT